MFAPFTLHNAPRNWIGWSGYRGRGVVFPFPLVFCCIVLVLVLSGCEAASNAQKGTATPGPAARATPALDVITAGTLTVGSYTNYPPQSYIDAHTRRIEGFDADLIRAIGQHLGLRVTIVSVEFASLAEYVVNSDVDLAISAIPITQTLQKKVQFVPYFQGGEALLVEKGNRLQITGMSSLCGLSVGVQTDTLEEDDLAAQSEMCKRNGKPAIKVVSMSDQQSLVQLLLKKQVVAVYQDAPQADYCIKQYPGRFELGGPITNTTMEGIAVRKDNASLYRAVQASLDTLRKNGTYHALIQKWGLVHEELARN